METMAADLAWTIYPSPLGDLTVGAGANGVRSVRFPEEATGPGPEESRPMPEIARRLDEYFAGRRRSFDLALDLRGTPLQLGVWERLGEIPYGATLSYAELAARVGPGLFPAGLEPWRRVRAVAAEVGRTPTPILIPCHRVIGSDGSLTGYGGGLHRKQALLDLERPQQSLL
jgi:methylated-DNA-[protein]-cysteine S-methyltransferase